MELVSNRPERTRAGTVFETDGEGALRLEQARPFGRRWLMRFSGIASRHQAEAVRGVVLRARPLLDDEALWVHELVGAEVVRRGHGESVGRVRAVLSNPASDVLELEDGRLVPVRFVVAHEAGRVEVDVPPGLLDE